MSVMTYDEAAALLWLRESMDAAPGRPMRIMVGALDKLTRSWTLAHRELGADVEPQPLWEQNPPADLDDGHEGDDAH